MFLSPQRVENCLAQMPRSKMSLLQMAAGLQGYLTTEQSHPSSLGALPGDSSCGMACFVACSHSQRVIADSTQELVAINSLSNQVDPKRREATAAVNREKTRLFFLSPFRLF